MPYLALKTALETPQNDCSIGSINKKLRARSSRALLGAEQQLRARSSIYALFGSMPERIWKDKIGQCTRRPSKIRIKWLSNEPHSETQFSVP